MKELLKELAEFIKDIFPYATSFTLFYLNCYKENKILRKNILKERMNNLYFPFYQKYFAGMLYTTSLSNASFETRAIFLDLFAKNLNFMETHSQKLYFNFYKCFLNLLEAFDNNPNYPLEEASKAFDNSFDLLAKSLMAEYANICYRLKMPMPVKFP